MITKVGLIFDMGISKFLESYYRRKTELFKKFFGRANYSKNVERLVSDKYKFVWVGVPKVASRSFLTVFFRKPEFDYGCRLVKGDLVELIERENLQNYYLFGFVRNPYARVVSCYLNKIVDPTPETEQVIISRYKGLYANMPFEEFVGFLLSSKFGTDEHGDRHWMSQYLQFVDGNETLLVDFVGKLENLDSDLEKVSKRIGIPKPNLPLLNTYKGWNATGDSDFDADYYLNYFCEQTWNMVRQRYKKDIELLGYSDLDFPPNSRSS